MIKWKLSYVMFDKEVSCVWLAKKLNLHVNTVRRHRKMQVFDGMPAKKLEQYCEALNCQPGDLLERV